MATSARSFAGFIFIVSALVLGAALLSQYWGGLAPCELCLKERWPWDAALAIAALVFLLSGRVGTGLPAIVLALIFAAGAALAFYHVGVEQHWFAGPSSCTTDATGAQTIDDLRRQLLATEPVLCDQVQWSLFGVSLAGWNLIASAAMALYCIAAARRRA
ncbi:MAG TPA: disulfide bond formation protein B [Stellaceae bacterium]|jgi:disulfide bond formation protein DsbB|nr:disulfide bond formation protein B [Stellaceae bacterium]